MPRTRKTAAAPIWTVVSPSLDGVGRLLSTDCEVVSVSKLVDCVIDMTGVEPVVDEMILSSVKPLVPLISGGPCVFIVTAGKNVAFVGPVLLDKT